MTILTRAIDLGLDARLHALARQAQRQADSSGRPVVATLVEPSPVQDPIARFVRAPVELTRALWWGADSLALVGLGEALALGPAPCAGGVYQGHGLDVSPAEIAREWRRLAAGALVDAPSDSPAPAGPLLLGGFAFDPLRSPEPAWSSFPPARLVLPRLLLVGEGGRWWLASTLVAWPGRDPAGEIEERRVGKECRSRWSPYH